MLGSSAPVNIPCSGDMHDRGLPNLSPPVTSPLGSLSHSLQLGSSSLNQTEHSLDKVSPVCETNAIRFVPSVKIKSYLD